MTCFCALEFLLFENAWVTPFKISSGLSDLQYEAYSPKYSLTGLQSATKMLAPASAASRLTIPGVSLVPSKTCTLQEAYADANKFESYGKDLM